MQEAQIRRRPRDSHYDETEIVHAEGLHPDFQVMINHTDVEGKDYIRIEAERTFSSPGEVNAWLNACAARVTHELFKLAESDDDA